MTLEYLREYVGDALLTLSVAEKEAKHHSYTQRTLFAQTIDLVWVDSLEVDAQRAEKVDAFVARFSRLQDCIGEKLLPRYAKLLGDTGKSMLDVLNYAERMNWLEDAEAFVSARKLRNLLVHEYMTDRQLFLDALRAANKAADQLIAIVYQIKEQTRAIGLTT